MSYILEALKKSDTERKRIEAPALDTVAPLPVSTASSQTGYIGWIVSGIMSIAILGLVAALYLRPDVPSIPTNWKPFGEVDMTPSPAPVMAPETETQTKVEPPVIQPDPEPTMGTHVEAPTPVVVEEPISSTEPADAPAPEQVPAPPLPPVVNHTQDDGQMEASPTTLETEVQSPEFKVIEPEVANLPQQDEVEEPQSPEVAVDASTQEPEAVTETPSKPRIISAPPQKEKAEPKQLSNAQINLRSKRKVELAWAAIDRGHYNQALRELDDAIQIQPDQSEAWFARGWTNEKAGNELSAIGDYARAIKAKPDHAFALFSRGYLNLYTGNPIDAITDFVRTQGVTDDPAFRLYTHLWLYLSRARANKDKQSVFSDDLNRENLSAWPGPLIQHLQGNISEGEVLAAIELGNSAQIKEHRCTGYFFLGVHALLAGDKDKARRLFERTLATGAVEFRQYDAAKRELEVMNLKR